MAINQLLTQNKYLTMLFFDPKVKAESMNPLNDTCYGFKQLNNARISDLKTLAGTFINC